MRVENSYVNGKGYLWKMDPSFSKRLLAQAFITENERDITNENKSNQSNYSSKYQHDEKVRKIFKTPKITSPENYTLSKTSSREPNNIGNELQIKIRPIKASDITEDFLKAHHIRPQSRERLKKNLAKKYTGE
ncbi:unnamed protein product [Meganyctiphanes norvegica]|uniref:Uncharacterized protein n=1 Tax=Meganyctiphanes norvegica TaxID=48144 RepID=A0AAV2STY7_MEGNR